MIDSVKTYLEFEAANAVITPEAFRKYLNGNNVCLDEYDDRLFRFYSWGNVKNVKDRLSNQKGIPNCTNIVSTMQEHDNCYVFADYMFSMFFYGIILKKDSEQYGKVYIISGDEFKLLADSFEDFIELHTQDSLLLQFG